MNSDLVQLTHIILYRLEKSVENSGEHFLNLKPGNDVRSPNEIISHLVDVSNYGLSLLDLPKAGNTSKSLLEKINENLMAMKSYLSKSEVDQETAKKLINGPLGDTLTHIGQLTLLRRLEGNPIKWENYTNVNT